MLNADHVLLNETLGNLDRLPTRGSTLVERVTRTGRTELLHNVLQTAALNVGDTVGVRADDHRAVDGTPAARFQKELGYNLENFTALLAK